MLLEGSDLCLNCFGYVIPIFFSNDIMIVGKRFAELKVKVNDFDLFISGIIFRYNVFELLKLVRFKLPEPHFPVLRCLYFSVLHLYLNP